MQFHQRTPGPPLDAFVSSVWLWISDRRPRALERVLPIGGAQLVINLVEDETRAYRGSPGRLVCERAPGSVLTGLTTRFQIIDTDEQSYVAGIVFRPGGTVPFVASPADELRDADVPLEVLWGRRRERRLREQLLASNEPQAALDILERALRDVWRDRTVHPAVLYALSEFRAHACVGRIRHVTDAIALSHRRFTERFKADVGLTPKRYCRLLRFQHVVTRAHRATAVDWGDLAFDCGYFDQAHLIHEFREFSGLTPTAYEALRTRFQNHVDFLQSVGD